MVLQRKTEEASMATKRLKELLESRKTSSRDTFGNSSGPGFQALMQALEHELEVIVRVHEVRCEYERQKEERVKMAKEVAELKDEANIAKQSTLSHCPQTMSPGARNSRIFALENMLATSSSTMVSMASQLSEAEERERAFSGRGRWNSVRSLADAKNIMNYLFNIASSSRCQLWDKEVDLRDRDSEIRSLKEKIVTLIRQVEMHKADLSRMEKMKKLYMSKSFKKKSTNQESMDDGEGRMYDLRPKGLRNSMAYNSSGNIDELLEDMEISESENSDLDETDIEWLHSDDFEDEWGHKRRQNAKKRNSKVVIENNPETEAPKTSPKEDGDTNPIQKAPSGVCCSCSKSSSCKTMKCECRSINGSCSMSCSCHPKKCSNRAAVSVQPHLGTPVTEDKIVNMLSDGDELDKNSSELASHGAMLLQAALSDKPVENKNTDNDKRKPLSDIGNKIAKPNAGKPPASRKKWGKSVPIQLVPVLPDQTSTQTEETEPPMKPESSTVEPTKLRLPRAIRSAISNANPNPNPLRDRNSELSNDSTINKESEPKSPRHHQTPTTKEKENQGQ
ncbi:hypothetical protein SSX86_009298 [Deinandra increscens subsp. villosa]|uniref:Tesmin/TSO1-like CXC domain-containing protein n=1 Tax=Deinandra increscens subsp. villosa TaxID=3103831 RepID=A0AAP0DKV9_9ASTR